MSDKFEKRIAALEDEVRELRSLIAVGANGREPDWRRTVGMFDGDETMKAIAAEGRKWREKERQKGEALRFETAGRELIILDTDHLSILNHLGSSSRLRLMERLEPVREDPIRTTIVNAEEQMRGWLEFLRKDRAFEDQVESYARLSRMLEFFKDWIVIPFEPAAAAECSRLRRSKIRIGTPDLKIAAIAIVHDALLLSANLRDFRKVPGLRVENWIE